MTQRAQKPTKQTQTRKPAKYRDILQVRFKEDPNEAIEHLDAMLGAPDEPHMFLRVLGEVAKAWGMSDLAEKTGLNREGLYDMLSDKGNPRFSSLLKVLDTMGLRLTIALKEESSKTTD